MGEHPPDCGCWSCYIPRQVRYVDAPESERPAVPLDNWDVPDALGQIGA